MMFMTPIPPTMRLMVATPMEERLGDREDRLLRFPELRLRVHLEVVEATVLDAVALTQNLRNLLLRALDGVLGRGADDELIGAPRRRRRDVARGSPDGMSTRSSWSSPKVPVPRASRSPITRYGDRPTRTVRPTGS